MDKIIQESHQILGGYKMLNVIAELYPEGHLVRQEILIEKREKIIKEFNKKVKETEDAK